ncbi:hypothetical protein H8K33_13030 [Undibacterium amnicola]|uniref:Uncharacterized protein n=1 Tax=Undibacterium amnicola TaxID=1834038 RepID=A0ABR6XSG4_9BURK|nr:hypothetical protein [Undibacterium amnicola]MBC3832423.1 hypothetical protein [Undibacterium amnicola]
MHSVKDLKAASNDIKLICLDAVTKFAHQNPNVPAQAVMIGVGELLIQFSVSHTGCEKTIHLLNSLRDAVVHLGSNEELV